MDINLLLIIGVVGAILLFSSIAFSIVKKRVYRHGFEDGQYAEPPQDMPYEKAVLQANLLLAHAASKAPKKSIQTRVINIILFMMEGVKYLPEYEKNARKLIWKGYMELDWLFEGPFYKQKRESQIAAARQREQYNRMQQAQTDQYPHPQGYNRSYSQGEHPYPQNISQDPARFQMTSSGQEPKYYMPVHPHSTHYRG
ncbi:hypothetical protein [Shimazuella alba]|uniref:Uncharacterized protein n=1 Tax=Shimazuella alba TaxID=2690964 RepID=A0A6I4VSH8_9BACL|nr:hypothetical protein [Shimazuella alba]MXQ54689.1 hypothetical protein [Shimazuella alba]